MLQSKKTADTAKDFSTYDLMAILLYRKCMNLGCYEEELNLLRNIIGVFKAIAFQTFDLHQSSQMRTQNWHALAHICDAIKERGI